MKTQTTDVAELLEIMKEEKIPITEIVNLINAKLGLIQRGSNPDEQEFALEIDYSKTLAEMYEAGHYDFISSYVNEKKFSIPKVFLNKKEIVVAKLLTFKGINENLSKEKRCKLSRHEQISYAKDKLIRKIDEKGLYGAGLIELLAFGKQFSTLQMQFDIVAPKFDATIFNSNPFGLDSRDKIAPILSFSEKGRELFYRYFYNIKEVDRILCICK
ncbi:MAG TPA: hypothetical protein VJ926_00840 [Patescibacteria group bacterium]|nr:hypothetical protein [Patescibacteria group bacterium]